LIQFYKRYFNQILKQCGILARQEVS